MKIIVDSNFTKKSPKHWLAATYMCFLALTLPTIHAKNIYISQNANGSDTGADAQNAHSITWLNSSSNWDSASNSVFPGDTIILTGTITNMLVIGGSGTPGSPITLAFDKDSRISIPAGTLISCQSKSNIVIDGRANGVLENTANGSSLEYQKATSGIYASGSSYLEIKNLAIKNLYIHDTNTDNATLPFNSNGALYMNGFGDQVSVHNCSFSEIAWVLNLQGGTGNGLNIYSNSFVNYDHGIAGLGSAYSNVNIFANHFGSTANWDTLGNVWHHDGIHVFFGAGGTLDDVQIYNNTFDGDWGVNNTAHMFFEGDFTHNNPNALTGFTIYNNLFVQYPGCRLNNGFVGGGGPHWKWYNNTFIGSGVSNSMGLSLSGSSPTIINNIFVNLTTFVSLSSKEDPILNNNLYANQTLAGNAPWIRNGIGYNTLSDWQKASTEGSSSFVTRYPVVNQDGSLISKSPAIGSGQYISDINIVRNDGTQVNSPWNIGAYRTSKVPSPSNFRKMQR